jgi:DNA recombination protein Rad52
MVEKGIILMDWKTVSEELAAPLDRTAIKPPPQGKFGEYVDALHVIREANRIFGFNGWSYTVERLEQTHSDVVDSARGPQLRCSFLCAVRVNVDGVIREGLAVGVGNGKPENAGDVIESAVKEAETDALKRALRTFGNTFGLALYDKDVASREVADPKPKPEAIATFKATMIDGIKRAPVAADVIRSNPDYIRDLAKLRDMDAIAASEVEEALNDKDTQQKDAE